MKLTASIWWSRSFTVIYRGLFSGECDVLIVKELSA